MATKKSSKKTAAKPASKATRKSAVKALQSAFIPCSDAWSITIPKGMEFSQPVTSETGDTTVKLSLSQGVAGKIQIDPLKLLSHKANFKLKRKK